MSYLMIKIAVFFTRPVGKKCKSRETLTQESLNFNNFECLFQINMRICSTVDKPECWLCPASTSIDAVFRLNFSQCVVMK